MRVVVIGGKGHVGTYLVPRLVEAGHEVICVCARQQQPYQPHAAWNQVKQVDHRPRGGEQDGTFGAQIRALAADVVIDMICFTLESAAPPGGGAARSRAALPALRHDLDPRPQRARCPPPKNSRAVPSASMASRKRLSRPICSTRRAATASPPQLLHPGHIVGPGWKPLNPAGHFNPGSLHGSPRGEELALPNLGMETVHHVHADDVAQAFMQAMAHWSTAVGESFHVVSPPGALLAWLRREHGGVVRPAGQPAYLPWEEWRTTVSPRGSAGNLGPHRSQPQLQHRQGAAPDRLPAALQLAAGRVRSGHVADRARGRSVVDTPDSRRRYDRQKYSERTDRVGIDDRYCAGLIGPVGRALIRAIPRPIAIGKEHRHCTP